MHYRAKQSIAFLVYAGILVSLTACVAEKPESKKNATAKDKGPNVIKVEHVVTQDGLECVRYDYGHGTSMSCNWPEYNWKRNNNKL